ncbi:MAG TPA: thioredoxin-like domain-containing protein [Gemmataceae bacterium]|nr:thioredoxin-like domain-containing protein [Gemmataceae bacterium]
MAKARVASGLLAGCLLLWGGAATAQAQQPTVAQMLTFKPRQEGIAISTPTKEEEANCKVELVRGQQPGSSGWLLLDPQGRPMRRFFDSDGDKKIDVWSYYKDGDEVYREIDTNMNDRADQYRWLNGGGMKWGIDANEDGKIDSWKMISGVEAAQEAYLAVAAQDFHRLRALFITEAELNSLKLSAKDNEQIRKQLAGAQAKFDETIKKLTNLNGKAQFIRVESAVPQCQADLDVIRSPNRIVMYQGADGKHDFLSTGAMVQVGLAWRLLDAPAPGDMPGQREDPNLKVKTEDPELIELQKKLEALEKTQPGGGDPGPNPELVTFCQKRGALFDQILPRLKTADQIEIYTKQIADNLSTWAQASPKTDKTALQRLSELVSKAAPGSPLQPYLTFRKLVAEYMPLLIDLGEAPKAQPKWAEELTKFVQAYPKAEDAPEALNYLAMGKDFGGTKENDEEAKRWYQQIVANFPDHPLAAKARGCIRRLELVGRPMELSAPTLGSGAAYDLAKQRGKVVVVYYWASISKECIGDFARLKQLHATYAAKGLELVGVNLDDTAEAASKFLQSNALAVPHLFAATKDNAGLSGPLAMQYGIMSLPTIILVGKDGNVINRSLQINDLEDAIKKAL